LARVQWKGDEEARPTNRVRLQLHTSGWEREQAEDIANGDVTARQEPSTELHFDGEASGCRSAVLGMALLNGMNIVGHGEGYM